MQENSMVVDNNISSDNDLFESLVAKNDQLQESQGKPTSKAKPKPQRDIPVLWADKIDRTVDPKAWLWYEQIPNELCIISAPGGVGKSTVVNWLVKHVSQGLAWPDGSPCEKGLVLLLDSERKPSIKADMLATVGADLKSIAIVPAELGSVKPAAFISKFRDENPDLRLAIVDVCRDFDDRLKGESNPKIEESLFELKTLATGLMLPIVLVTHEPKNSASRPPEDRIIGTTFWRTNCQFHVSLQKNDQYGPKAITGEISKRYTDRFDPWLFEMKSEMMSCGLKTGYVEFKQRIPLEEFLPPVPHEEKKGRGKSVSPDLITKEVIAVLTEHGGTMPGRPPRPEAGKKPDKSVVYCAKEVADRLTEAGHKITAYTVGEHYRDLLDKRCVDGWRFDSWKDQNAFAGKFLWYCSKEAVTEVANV